MTTWNRDDTDLSTLTGIASTTVGSLRLTGTTIGHISDTDILNFSSNQLEIKASNILFSNSVTGDDVLSFTLNDDMQITSPEGDMKFTALGSFELDARTGIVYLKDEGVIYGSLNNNSGNLLIKSGTTTALTFSGANSQFSGNVEIGGNIIGESNISLGGSISADETLDVQGLIRATSGIKLGNNTIYASDGGSTITLDTNDNVTIAGSLTCNISSGDGSSENFVVEQSGLLLKRTAAQVRSDLGISDAEIVDWTTDQGGTNIHSGNYENTQLSDEQVQDIVGAMFSGNTETNTSVTYQDADGTIDVVTTLDGAPLTTEAVQDIVGAMFASNTETRISATYEDGDGTIDLVVDDMTANTQLTSEEVQDIVGAMFTSNTETRISATYEDGDGTIDLVVDDMSNVTGDNGNAAIYDNSGTPALKSGITKAEVLSLLNVADGAEVNVNADWNSSSGDSQISNKPTLVTALNGLSDVTYSSGDLTISGLDKIISGSLDFDSTGHINFDGCAAGFTRTTYADAADVTVDFRTGNKAHLDMTGGSISGTLTLQFPAVSGNFVLVVQQDGSTRTIAAYATKDAAGNAGNNDGGTGGAIRWAGGSAPDLTDGGNKRDVLSFYWDATEEVCYGVASLNF